MSEPEILPAPDVDFPEPDPGRWEREHQAFLDMLPALRKTHRDRYVAVHDGRVVDSGDDLIELALRSYKKYGYESIYVDLVADKMPPPVRVPSPRRVVSQDSP